MLAQTVLSSQMHDDCKISLRYAGAFCLSFLLLRCFVARYSPVCDAATSHVWPVMSAAFAASYDVRIH